VIRIAQMFLAAGLVLAPLASVAVEDDGLEKMPAVKGFKLWHNVGEDNLPGDESAEAEGFIEADFDGRGEVKVEKGVVYIGKGNDMTGIRWTGPLIRMNYEISLQAKRVDGSDFFCGLTFPYGEKPCSLVVGGWGGGVVGISNIDYQDAYNNETCEFKVFENDKWYDIRLRVTPKRIKAWIDGKEIVNVETTDKDIDIRSEMEWCRPLGVATWRTTGAVRGMNFHAFKEAPEEAEEE